MGSADLPVHPNVRMRRSADVIKRNSREEILRRSEVPAQSTAVFNVDDPIDPPNPPVTSCNQIRCFYCKRENRESAKFCKHCRASLELLCSCGEPLEHDSAFCDQCGTAISEIIQEIRDSTAGR